MSWHRDTEVLDAAGNESAVLTGSGTYTPAGVLGVEIDQPATASPDGRLRFKFTFGAETATEGAGAFTISDITVSNAEALTDADLQQSVSDTMIYWLTVTPKDPTDSVTVQLNEDAVSDDAAGDDKKVAGQVSATFTPPIPDEAPEFASPTVTRSIAENTAANMNIGAAITATDADTLTYTLGGTDAASFAIDSATGQLQTKEALDYEAKPSYTVTVTATDGGSLTATTTVTITVTDVDETMPDTTKPSFTVVMSPANGSELTAGGTVQFTLTATKNLGSGNNALLDTNVEGTTNVASKTFVKVTNTVYVVVVTPTDHTQPIVLTIAADAVMDTATTPNGNAVQTIKFTPEDDTPPTVVITSDAGTGDDADKIVFTFTFSEPIKEFTADDLTRGTGVTLAGNPTVDPDNNKVYTVLVDLSDDTILTLTLNTGSVMDMQGNALVGDQRHTYVAPDAETAATIPTTALGNSTAGGTLTVTFSKDPGTVATTATGYTISTAGRTRTITVPADKTAGDHSIALTWDNDGSGTVTYTIPAIDPNTSPEITIAAGGFVVVVRNTADIMGALLKTYDPTITLASWMAMPDLQNVFETDIPLTGPAHGGGALILTRSGTTAVHPGTVGISEIMWAINESHLNDANARSADQWIELHNLNTEAVTVKLSWKTGARDIAADTSINGNLAAPYLDVVTNVFHDRPGNAHWILPGSNGNPVIGQNFVSAARKGTFSLTSKHQNKFNKRYTRSDSGANATNSPDGRNKDQWAASSVRYAYRTDTITTTDGRSFNVAYEDHGTPGRVNSFSPERADTKEARTNVPSNTVIFNEVANRHNEAYEWIELRNVSDSEKNLKNYLISIVESKPNQADRNSANNDKIFYQFPSNDKAKIAPGGVFLLVASDPRDTPDHPLAVGYNVDIDDEEQVVGSRKNPVKYKVMRKDDQNAYQYEGLGLPDSGDFILILRRPDNHEGHRSGDHGGKGVAERGKDDLDKVIDVAGRHPDLHITDYPNAVSETRLWPLRGFRAPSFDNNKFSPDIVRLRIRGAHGLGGVTMVQAVLVQKGFIMTSEPRGDKMVIAVLVTNAKRLIQTRMVELMAITIRSAEELMSADNPAKVIISEIMMSQGNRGNLPQWIELYNPSKTHAINLEDNAGWRLVIENAERAPIITIFDGNVKKILPNQTVLIVSSSARDYGSDTLPRGTVFPNTRVLNAYLP